MQLGRLRILVRYLVTLEIVLVVLRLHGQQTLHACRHTGLLKVNTHALPSRHLSGHQRRSVLGLHMQLLDLFVLEKLKPLFTSDLHQPSGLGPWDVLSVQIQRRVVCSVVLARLHIVQVN